MSKKATNFLKKHKKPLLKFGLPIGLVLFGLIAGYLGTGWVASISQPKNLVWAAEAQVKVPGDLKSYLQKRNDCKDYRGVGTPTGVGLWGVYQVEKGQFAKIAYGCSWTLTSYIMAAKQNNKWFLIPPTEYFAASDPSAARGSSNLPKCTELTKYKINKTIEPFCIDAANQPQPNSLP